MTHDRPPLSRFRVTSTSDLDEARTAVARSLCPHRLDLTGRAFRLRHSVVTVGRVGMHYIDYGGDVQVEADGLPFLLVQIPLSGSMQVSSMSDDVVVAPGRAVVTGVASGVRMTYRDRNPRLMLRIAPGDVLARGRRVCGEQPDIRSTSVVDLTTGPGRTLRNLVDLIVTDYDDGGDGDRHRSGLADSLGTAVIDALVCARSHPGDLATPALPGPRVVRRAVEVIRERCGEPLTVADVAEATDTSVRSLQALFRNHLGTTLAAYIRVTRLEGVRRDLRSGAVPSVTDAAHRWAVPHLGRFSRDYRTMFGELPSETLRAARGA